MNMDIIETDTIRDYIICSSINSFCDVKELTVDRFLFGDIVTVSLYDLDNFPNLESLTLSNLTISYDDFMCICRCHNLKKLELHNCEIIDEIEDLFNDLGIDNLVIDNTNFDFSLVSKDFNYVCVVNSKYDSINGYINELDVNRAEVDFNNIDFSNISSIVISSTQYSKNEEVFKNIMGKVKITVNEDNSYFVEGVYE